MTLGRILAPMLNETDFEDVLKLPVSSQGAIVIPAYDESPETLGRLLDSCDPNALAIVVVNRGVSSPWVVKEANDRLIAWLKDRYSDIFERGIMTLLSSESGKPDLLLVDQNQDDHLLFGGVGQARQVGCDLAAQLINHRCIGSRWIHNTDADSILPKDLFIEADKIWTPESAVCLRVTRSFSDDPALAAIGDLHDVSSYMAILAMERARAPWAVMVTGCGVAISVDAYLRSGGVQPYVRAEDGHLLNATCKLGTVHRIFGEPVLTEARDQSRPPTGFGTTIASVKDALAAGQPIVCARSEQWDLVSAFYMTIEICLTKKQTVAKASQTACEACGCGSRYPYVTDAVYTWAGPIDAMAQQMSARDIYESTHLALDLRRSRKAHKSLMALVESVPIEEAIKINTWAGASGAKDVHEACELVRQKLSETCWRPTGPLTWTDRLFPA